MPRFSAALLAIIVLACAPDAHATNIVLNAGFEDGTAGWSSDGWLSADFGGHESDGVVGSGCVGSFGLASCRVQQTLSTVTSQRYALSLWVAEEGGATSGLRIEWGGLEVLNVLNPNNDSCEWTGRLECNWVKLFVSSLVATSDATTLTIYGRHDPGAIYVDDIVVEEVPEPASMALLATGLAGGAVGRLRRRLRPRGGARAD